MTTMTVTATSSPTRPTTPTPRSKRQHPKVMDVSSDDGDGIVNGDGGRHCSNGNHAPLSSSSSPFPSPFSGGPSSPTTSLELYKRNQSRGRIMVCEARERHVSVMAAGFAGHGNKVRTLESLREKLKGQLGRLGRMEFAGEYLAVATGNMLERIVSWDRDRAEMNETDEGLLLSTVPRATSIDNVDARYLIEMFRKAMRKVPPSDIRFSIGQLDEGLLMALLHFTFLVSRPVLAWELDLDRI